MIPRDPKSCAIASIYVASAMLKLFLAAYLPALILAFAGHDDALFMRLGEQLGDGKWLGKFNEYTLAKGPGYPAFLAFSHFTGLPVTITTGLLQLAAIAVAAWATYRLSASRVAAAAMFALLALNPVGYSTQLTRIIRDQIYWPQTLVVFALFSVLLLAPPQSAKARLRLEAAAGAVLGWAWLTREEGVWFLPGIAVLILASLVLAYRQTHRLRVVATGLAVAFATFAGTHLTFMTGNLIAYGSFVGVDFKEKNFKAALAALQSVEVGQRIPRVPVSLAARTRIAEVSPAFRPVAAMMIPGGSVAGWAEPGCVQYKETCGEIAGGFFVWALRQSISIEKRYGSPADASEAFGEIAREVEAACTDGRLTCREGLLSFMPPLVADQWTEFPGALVAVARNAAFAEWPADIETPASFPPENAPTEFLRRLSFLNRPVSALPESAWKTNVGGWYYDAEGAGWPSFHVASADGSPVEFAMDVGDSPDIVLRFSDARANRNRIAMSFVCPDVCTVSAIPAGRPPVRLVADGRSSRWKSAEGATLHIDAITPSVAAGTMIPTDPLPLLANAVRLELSRAQNVVLPPFLVAGLVAFLAVCIRLAWRKALPGAIALAALAAWAFVATRIVILAVIDVTAFPAVNYLYAAPAAYMAVVAAVLSIASLAQILAPAPRP